MSAGISHPVRLAPVPDGTVSLDQLAALRAMLEEQRAFRIDQLAELRQAVPQSPPGSADREILRSLRRAALAALRDVQGALWRMDDGTYGRCLSCDDPIPLERLEILPQSALCLACHRRPGV